MEAETKIEARSDSKEGLRLPGEELRASRAFTGTRRPDRNQEALQQKARWEKVEVWEVLEEVRSPVRLEST